MQAFLEVTTSIVASASLNVDGLFAEELGSMRTHAVSCLQVLSPIYYYELYN